GRQLEAPRRSLGFPAERGAQFVIGHGLKAPSESSAEPRGGIVNSPFTVRIQLQSAKANGAGPPARLRASSTRYAAAPPK
ncbi:MAG: hypothetical protein K2Z80_25100, partial [Xanthobacteraceae bacterium]|nr:hypothetical protein [Xanthobacteraceae bacterium]